MPLSIRSVSVSVERLEKSVTSLAPVTSFSGVLVGSEVEGSPPLSFGKEWMGSRQPFPGLPSLSVAGVVVGYEGAQVVLSYSPESLGPHPSSLEDFVVKDDDCLASGEDDHVANRDVRICCTLKSWLLVFLLSILPWKRM